MDFNTLNAFKTVAEEQSITKAAEKLCIVPSAITARIQQLERDLDKKLFYRERKGMLLTPHGKVLLGYANQIMVLLDEAKKLVSDDGLPQGELCIGATATAATVYLPGVFAQYHHDFPDVDLQLTSDVTDRLIEKVLDHSIDLAIVNRSVEHDNIEQHHLCREELVLITAKSITSYRDFEKCVLCVAPTGCIQRTRLEQWFQEEGMPPYRVMECSSIDMRLSYVAAGIGVAILPLSTLCRTTFKDTVRVHRMPEAYRFLNTYAIRKNSAAETSAQKAFLNAVFEETKNHTPIRYAGSLIA